MTPRRRVLLPLLLLGAYVAWPYYGVYSLDRALETGDRHRLEESVSFDELRESLKDELNAEFAAAVVEEDADLGTALASVLAPHLIETIVDGYVTPAGLSRLLAAESGSEESAGPPTSPLSWGRVEHAFFRNPSLFAVQLDTGASLRFRIRDWSWKLVSIALPAELNTSLAEATETSQSASERVEQSATPIRSPLAPTSGWRSESNLDQFSRVTSRFEILGIAPLRDDVSFERGYVILRANSTYVELSFNDRETLHRNLRQMFRGQIRIIDHWTGEHVAEI